MPYQVMSEVPEEPEHLLPRPRKTKALPLSIRYTEKFQFRDGKLWRKQDIHTQAASVDLLTTEEALKFEVDGGFPDNSTVCTGFPIPKEIIAVVRPQSANASVGATAIGQGVCRGGQESILAYGMEMKLEVKLLDFVPPEEGSSLRPGGMGGAKVVYSGNARASTKRNVKGLYCFSTEGNQLQRLFNQMGTYMFHFSLVGSEYGDIPPAVVRVNVAPSSNSANVNHWNLGSKALAVVARAPKQPKGRKRSWFEDLDEDLDDLGARLLPKKDITLVHVTTLDEMVSVNSYFAMAVFLGLAFSPPIPTLQGVTSLAPPRTTCYVGVDMYRGLVFWEVLSFGCFLFSTLVAHGFKLFIVLGNGNKKDNAKTVEVSHTFFRFGIMAAGMGSILGSIFMIISMIALIQVRLGNITCGNPWALQTTIPLVALGVSGCMVFIVPVLYESLHEY